jgi:poly-gamma-glutamate synthesis protein (capsule biosynthesis protein)
MRRIVFRVLRAFGIGLGGLLVLFLSWAIFTRLYNPRVPLAEPIVIDRPRTGERITVVLGGDFAPTDAAMPAIREKGWTYPYEATRWILNEADVAFLNLEAPVTASGDEFPLYKKYIYKVDPAAVPVWNWLGLDVVSLANNHIGDYRDRGVVDTVRHLDEAGIAHVGAGGDETAARRPVIFDVGGTRIGFLAYLEDGIFYDLYLRAFAVGNTVGCAQMNATDLSEDVRRLRPLVDVLIVSVHWGENYSGVTGDQERFARRMADLGVDVVAGHHAHDVQPAQVLDRTLVLYSLGNYAWGTPGYGHLRVGLLARLHVVPRSDEGPGRMESAELLPIVTQNRIVQFQPRPLAPEEWDWLDPFRRGTEARGVRLRRGEGTSLWIDLPEGPTERSSGPGS